MDRRGVPRRTRARAVAEFGTGRAERRGRGTTSPTACRTCRRARQRAAMRPPADAPGGARPHEQPTAGASTTAPPRRAAYPSIVERPRRERAAHRTRGSIVEKPFGRDLDVGARAERGRCTRCFDESQIFRIDHYLGKETVQNILVFRFANGIFEPIWNRRYVDNVQITVAETIGVEGRGGFYEQTGALRDMVAEPPVPGAGVRSRWSRRSRSSPTRLRDEKVKVLRAMQVCRPARRRARPVRGLPRRARRGARLTGRDLRGAARWRSTAGAGPACRSTCGPARA